MAASQIPAYTPGTPVWAYIAGILAVILVTLAAKAPELLAKRKGAGDTKPPTSAAAIPPIPGDSSAGDNLRAMIADQQARADRAEKREDELYEKVIELTGRLAAAEAEIGHLKAHNQALMMGRGR